MPSPTSHIATTDPPAIVLTTTAADPHPTTAVAHTHQVTKAIMATIIAVNMVATTNTSATSQAQGAIATHLTTIAITIVVPSPTSRIATIIQAPPATVQVTTIAVEVTTVQQLVEAAIATFHTTLDHTMHTATVAD